jgi:hypothetical protein
MLKHPFKNEWIGACDIEYQQLNHMNTWTPVPKNSIDQAEVLPLKWVFKYKFDDQGFLSKFKARICVRGDLQPISSLETRATTLAARTLRTILALAAAFDLESAQLDAVNAFLNSSIDEIIYVSQPPGYGPKSKVLRLCKALYGLRRAPFLWQKDIGQTLKRLGLKPIPEDPCLFTNGYLILMIYVDDIIILYHIRHHDKMLQLKNSLLSTYKMKDLGQMTQFLNIKIFRDRSKRKLWISQADYIEKIAHRFHLTNQKAPKTPLPSERLYKDKSEQEYQATKSFIHQYQQKVGSALYAAIISRPDTAQGCRLLSEFLQNPTPRHMDAINQLIAYLYSHRHLAIEYSGNPDKDPKKPVFQMASDAAFADNVDRKSSEGYICKLFSGPVDWSARKQKTVTLSTTEAEFLALTSASRQFLWWKRLFKALEFDPEEKLTIQCDNQQTVDLLTKENSIFKTKLKHVDIHQHWLRQEIEKESIEISWISTNQMIADGLTKRLTYLKHQAFLNHLNMKDISKKFKEND